MKKSLWVVLSLALSLLVGLSLALLRFDGAVHVQARLAEGPKRSGPASTFDRINEKARASKTGGLAQARELADAVVDPYVDPTSIVNADGTMTEVKDRLASAEFDYRHGRGKEISEDRVIRVVNGLCKKFDAPEYAKTDRTEVRTHRMALLALTPDLVTINHSQAGNQTKNVPAGISPTMSPLEAANVAMSLVYQKVFNEEYQKDAGERELQRRARHSGGASAIASSSENSARASERTAEMVRIVRRGGLPLILPGRAKGFATRTLDILGIPPLKEKKS